MAARLAGLQKAPNRHRKNESGESMGRAPWPLCRGAALSGGPARLRQSAGRTAVQANPFLWPVHSSGLPQRHLDDKQSIPAVGSGEQWARNSTLVGVPFTCQAPGAEPGANRDGAKIPSALDWHQSPCLAMGALPTLLASKASDTPCGKHNQRHLRQWASTSTAANGQGHSHHQSGRCLFSATCRLSVHCYPRLLTLF